MTLEEAVAVKIIMENGINDSLDTASIIKRREAEIPDWLEKQIQLRSNIYDKITAAIDASY